MQASWCLSAPKPHARMHARARGCHALTDTNAMVVQDDILNELEHL